jgi:integral membrane protein
MEELVERALARYRIMSIVTGTALILLFVVAFPLTLDHHPLFGKVLGVAHGVFLYPLYLITVAQLAFLTRLRWWWWLFMAMAGFIPFVAFIMEHVVTKEIRKGSPSAMPTDGGRLA